jgi:hypothetical protein
MQVVTLFYVMFIITLFYAMFIIVEIEYIRINIDMMELDMYLNTY